ncbi:MAG: reverse transcriptase domain-containing protein [Bacillota bacterium]
MDKLRLVKSAYKKLKSSVYYDKTQLLMRDRIVGFESDELFKNRMDKLSAILEDAELFKLYQDEFLESVTYSLFPKSLAENSKANKKDDSWIIGFERDAQVDKTQSMFSANVEVQILGVIWVMLIGKYIDDDVYENSYGNRLRKTLNEDKMLYDSPHLFKPYFEQYESWRDNGIKIAENFIDQGKDVAIFTMDLMSFYYSMNFTQAMFDDIFEKYGDRNNFLRKDVLQVLHNFIFKVIEKYECESPQKFKGRNCLPIGFLPSSILSNWYLQAFDSKITSDLNPLYYGRYVDDIIIVDKLEKNSEIHIKAEAGELNKEWLLKNYFCNNKVLRKSGTLYYLNKTIIPSNNDSEIAVQNDKVKVFYFKGDSSKALLKAFRKNISKNKSEFRYLPEEEDALIHSDYSDIFELHMDKGASINKFREINEAEINKFNLSKFLGKLSKITAVVVDEKENKFIEDINKLFDKRFIISNYMFWERILQLLVENKQYEYVYAFMSKVQNSIIGMNVTDWEEDDMRMIKIRLSLFKHLYSSYVRVVSITWGQEIERLNTKVEKEIFSNMELKILLCYSFDNILVKRIQYCVTRMSNKHNMPIFIEGLFELGWTISDNLELNLCDYDSCMNYICTHRNSAGSKSIYKYSPYTVTMSEIEYWLYIKEITSANKKMNFHKLNESVKLFREYNTIMFYDDSIHDGLGYCEERSCNIKNAYVTKAELKDSVCDKVKIAIANVKVNKKNIEDLLIEKPNRSIDRYLKLTKVINQATAENVNVLVLPECCVPFEWLPSLAKHCTKNNLSIITGVEYVKCIESQGKSKIVNLVATLLPYTISEKFNTTHINLRNKVHYAPSEIVEITGYDYCYNEGDCYDLFSWNNFWFAPYCCYELTSIKDRSIFASCLDAFIAVEMNKDTNYFSNIIESLGRDMHCYCIQVNTSIYGDSRVYIPRKTENKDLIKIKGGDNDTVLVATIDINALRDFQMKGYSLQQIDGRFKPTPPDLNKCYVKGKVDGSLFDTLLKNI